MKATAVEVAVDAFALTSDGPRLVAEIERGDKLVVVERGRERLARVQSVKDTGAIECVRMLTALGDIAVPAASRVMTRSGPRAAGEIASAVRAGEAVRVETIRPAPGGSAVTAGGPAAEVALRALVEPPRAVQLPLACGSLAETTRKAYGRIGIKVSARGDDRWAALVRDGKPASRRASARPIGARELMSALAWEVLPDGSVEARLTGQEHALRRLLIASLVAEDLPFTMKWVPAYRPIEARVRLSEDGWPAFVSVGGARPEALPSRALTIASERAALALGLVLVA